MSVRLGRKQGLKNTTFPIPGFAHPPQENLKKKLDLIGCADGTCKKKFDPHGRVWQGCKQDYWCPGGGVNLLYACPSGLYSTPGSDSVSQCRCPDFSRSDSAAGNVSLCTCNAGYYKVVNASNKLGGWQCQVRRGSLPAWAVCVRA